jgi:diadenosine tetraphosphatase ApaH/serine/threonine PP2A family protein phosphatase
VLIGIVSDVHSNLLALEAVLSHMGEVDALWCLGDLVGYGPWPNECVGLLRERGVVAIAGNHDLAAVGSITTEEFNPDAARATAWTTDHLSPETRAYLEELEPHSVVDGITLAHGTPNEPIWEYLLNNGTAAVSFECFETQVCLVGHTHIPSVFVQDKEGAVGGAYMEPGTAYALGAYRVIANPGSVGQPRDRNPLAAYLLFDSEQYTLEWRRVEYDLRRVQARILDAGLPTFFAERLGRGV